MHAEITWYPEPEHTDRINGMLFGPFSWFGNKHVDITGWVYDEPGYVEMKFVVNSNVGMRQLARFMEDSDGEG